MPGGFPGGAAQSQEQGRSGPRVEEVD
jgi:hypothetical protein